MTRIIISQLARQASRPASSRLILSGSRASTASHARPVAIRISKLDVISFSRSFSAIRPVQKGLSPETDNPQPKVPETSETASAQGPADITEDRFHELSDEYLNTLVEKLEHMQEEREDIDCEFSAGVLTLNFPPHGTYVLNKQPPNKQVWLSSPLSGPKRYDWVVASEGQDAKEGTGSGEWIYLRDGSTLTTVLRSEIGVDMSELFKPAEQLYSGTE